MTALQNRQQAWRLMPPCPPDTNTKAGAAGGVVTLWKSPRRCGRLVGTEVSKINRPALSPTARGECARALLLHDAVPGR